MNEDIYELPEIRDLVDEKFRKAVDEFVDGLLELRKREHMEPGVHEANSPNTPGHPEPGIHEKFALDRVQPAPQQTVGSAQGTTVTDNSDPCLLCGKNGVCGCGQALTKAENLEKGALGKLAAGALAAGTLMTGAAVKPALDHAKTAVAAKVKTPAPVKKDEGYLPGDADGDGLAKKHIGFTKLKNKLAHKPGVTDPAALAASIGRKKYGAKGMAEKAAAAKKSEMDGVSGDDGLAMGEKEMYKKDTNVTAKSLNKAALPGTKSGDALQAAHTAGVAPMASAPKAKLPTPAAHADRAASFAAFTPPSPKFSAPPTAMKPKMAPKLPGAAPVASKPVMNAAKPAPAGGGNMFAKLFGKAEGCLLCGKPEHSGKCE